jgi:hypothetical protein
VGYILFFGALHIGGTFARYFLVPIYVAACIDMGMGGDGFGLQSDYDYTFRGFLSVMMAWAVLESIQFVFRNFWTQKV